MTTGAAGRGGALARKASARAPLASSGSSLAASSESRSSESRPSESRPSESRTSSSRSSRPSYRDDVGDSAALRRQAERDEETALALLTQRDDDTDVILLGIAAKQDARQAGARREDARREDARRDARREDSRREDSRREDARREDARLEDARREDARREDARREDSRRDGDWHEDSRREDARREVARREVARRDGDRQTARRGRPADPAPTASSYDPAADRGFPPSKFVDAPARSAAGLERAPRASLESRDVEAGFDAMKMDEVPEYASLLSDVSRAYCGYDKSYFASTTDSFADAPLGREEEADAARRRVEDREAELAQRLADQRRQRADEAHRLDEAQREAHRFDGARSSGYDQPHHSRPRPVAKAHDLWTSAPVELTDAEFHARMQRIHRSNTNGSTPPQQPPRRHAYAPSDAQDLDTDVFARAMRLAQRPVTPPMAFDRDVRGCPSPPRGFQSTAPPNAPAAYRPSFEAARPAFEAPAADESVSALQRAFELARRPVEPAMSFAPLSDFISGSRREP